MPTRTADVAIIGGGLMGCWTAFFLRKRGARCILLEKGAIGAQASGVNFGNLRIQARHLDQLPLSLRAHELWESLEQLIGNSCEFEASGHLRIAFTEAEKQVLVDYAREARPHGLDLQLLDQSELRRRWPWLALAVTASWSPRDGTANPRLSAPAVARAARALGAEIVEGAKVVGIEARAGLFRLAVEGDLAVEAPLLLNSAGAWAAAIAASFGEGVPLFAAGPPQFVTEALPRFIGPSVQAVDGSVIFHQVPRGNVVVAGYPRGPSDAIANRAPVAPLKTVAHMARLGQVVPALAGAHIIRVWSGIEGYMPDMLPIMGRSGTTPGLFHAFGFCGHGFQLAPGVGLVMSELILDGQSPTPLDAFAITRFAGASPAARLAEEFDATLMPR
jgi:sarcosine oxidase, subunit beta